MNLKPLADNVVLKISNPDAYSQGGIFIPEKATDQPARGTVVAVGPGKILPDGGVGPMNLKIGDDVLFPKYSGTNITVDSELFILVPEPAIMGHFCRDDE